MFPSCLFLRGSATVAIKLLGCCYTEVWTIHAFFASSAYQLCSPRLKKRKQQGLTRSNLRYCSCIKHPVFLFKHLWPPSYNFCFSPDPPDQSGGRFIWWRSDPLVAGTSSVSPPVPLFVLCASPWKEHKTKATWQPREHVDQQKSCSIMIIYIYIHSKWCIASLPYLNFTCMYFPDVSGL